MIKRLDLIKPKELQKISAANKGKRTLIIVHPYWVHPNPKFDRFIKSKRHEKFITIVMEYHKDIPRLREKLESFGLKESNSFFIVGTKREMADPIYGWQKLIGRIESLGATEIIVSGRNIEKLKVEEIIKEMNLAKTHRTNRPRYSKIRAIKKASNKTHGYGACAGITFSKIKASGRFIRVKLSRHFL